MVYCGTSAKKTFGKKKKPLEAPKVHAAGDVLQDVADVYFNVEVKKNRACKHYVFVCVNVEMQIRNIVSCCRTSTPRPSRRPR